MSMVITGAFAVLALVLLLVFFWAVSRNGEASKLTEAESIAALHSSERRSIVFWPQVRQALSGQDLDYVRERAPNLLRQISRERRDVAFEYLRGLRHDFEQMLHLATAIAVLSPEVQAVHEWERLRLTTHFWLQYRTIQLRLLCSTSSLQDLHELNNTVSGLMQKLDDAVRELGEHAALAFELKSSLDNGGLRQV
jgi:hypothetical protein